ncbi:MAG: Lrp/AsnC family transcriptional regulator [Candidatus Competibacterales bacterium]|nr:Lrp/AsnC family transcriptional regulator [Candidatus Competibacterales bacterium]
MAGTPAAALTPLERRLLNDFQRDLPLTPRPFAAIAAELGVDEARVLDALQDLTRRGLISRVGPVFAPRRAGVGTLAALAVPPARLEAVARLVSGYPEVNHNYQREHRYNLWFVLTAPDRARLDAVLADIERRTGLAALDLPLERDYHIDLGFPLELT